MNLAQFSFRNSRGILLLALFVSLLGGLAAARMPAAILPDFPFPRLVVVVDAGDMAIQEMLIRVTRPMEGAAAGVPGAKLVRSKTARGSLELSVDFDWGTAMFEAFSRLNANVAAIRAELPADAKVDVEWVNPSSFPVIGYAITSDRLSPRDLYELGNLNLAPYLSRLNGVYRVLVQGGEAREYDVLLDPAALAAAGVTPDQVSTAISDANFVQSVGRFSEHVQGYLVLVDSRARNRDDLLNVVIAGKSGRIVRVRDVGTVREAEAQRQQVITAGPPPREAVLLNILKQPGASTADVSREVKQALGQLRTSLPPGVSIASFYDEADLLNESQASLRDSILVGAILAFIVLLGFLRSWRTTLVVLICLPLTVLIAFLGLSLVHQTLNLMTLGGLAVGLGLIIDDVVVPLENIFRHGELGKPPREAALDGAWEIQKPLIGSTITRIAVFLPLAFLSEITGALFAPLSITLTLLLVISMALAVTVVPLVTSYLLKRGTEQTAAHKPSGAAGSAYERMTRFAMRYPAPSLAAVLGMGLLAAAVVPSLPTGLLPDMDEGAFVLDYKAAAGTPLAATDEQVRQIEDVLRQTPEVAAYSRRTGAEMGFFTTEPDRGDFMVKLKPRSERKRSMHQVMDAVSDECQGRLPGMTIETTPPIADRVGDIAGDPSPIDVKIFGDDPAELDRLAAQVSKVVESVPGTAESVHEVTATGPELAVHVDPRRAGMLGVSPRDVAKSLEAAMLGRVDTSIVSGEKVIGVRVAYPRADARTRQQIGELPVLSKSGKPVPLSAIATFTEAPGAHEVTRENQKPVMEVKAVLKGRDLGSVNRDVQEKVAREVKLPSGYTLQFGGLYASQQASFTSLVTVLLLGMFLVYLVSLFQYNRFGEPTALVLAGAFALAGVVWALKLTGTYLNASSLTGGIMIFGMVLTNGTVLMDTIEGIEQEGHPLPDAIVSAGRLRLRPIFMTTAIAVLTLLPLAFGIGSGAEMQQPLAIAVIGGLVVSPFFTLVLAPLLLYVLRRGR